MHEATFFNKNMNALEEKYPALAKKVKKIGRIDNKYKIVGSNSGDPNIVIARDLNFLMLYDRDNPKGHCKEYLESLHITYAPIVIFLGLGLGYHPYLFMEHHGKSCQTKKIIIFEKDPNVFRIAMELVDLQYIISHPDIFLFVDEEPEEACIRIRKDILVETDAHSHMRSTKIVPLPSSIESNSEYYSKLLYRVKRSFSQQMILAGNDPIDAFLGLDNMLMNVKNIVSSPGINLLYDKFKGRPAVTVASGPSLNKNMHLLKDLRDKALIICCDGSFLPLMKRNIRPHIVATMERTDGTEYFFEPVPDFDGVYLAFCPLVRPKGFDSYKGKKLIVNRPFSHFDWLHQDKGTLSFGPSVANMAFKMAEALGCDPIILIGQDLAFADDGDTHVKDMPFGERDDYYHRDVLMVEGNNGKQVKTSKQWDIFRAHFEEDLQSYEGLCINATEGGAKLWGAQVSTFKETVDRYCTDTFCPDTIIDEAVSHFYEDLDVLKDYSDILSRTDDTHESLTKLIQSFKEFHNETRLAQKTIINPFIHEGAAMKKEPLMGICTRFLDTMSTYLKDQNVHDIMMHTLQPNSIWFANRLNSLSEIYTDEDCLLSAQVLMIKEWLGVIGQLFVSTQDLLEMAKKKITIDMEKECSVA